MALTIFEVLLNAQYNICRGKIPLQLEMGKRQLDFVIEQLEAGKSLTDKFVFEEHS